MMDYILRSALLKTFRSLAGITSERPDEGLSLVIMSFKVHN